jgi:hypothetical protein
MTRSDCQCQAARLAARLAEPFRDLGFMLSCYDVYSAPPSGICPGAPGEAQRLLGHQGDGT